MPFCEVIFRIVFIGTCVRLLCVSATQIRTIGVDGRELNRIVD